MKGPSAYTGPWHCVLARGVPPVLVPLSISVEVGVLWTFQLPLLLKGEDIGYLFGGFFAVLLAAASLATLVSSFFAVFTDPGYLPTGNELQDLACHRAREASVAVAALKDMYTKAFPASVMEAKGVASVKAGILDIARTPPPEPRLGRGRLTEPRWCATCNIWRPPLSSHCACCGRCCIGFDHHCYVIGKCVGARNHRSFFLLCTIGTVSSTAILVLSLWQATNRDVDLWFREWWCAFIVSSLILLASIIVSVMKWTCSGTSELPASTAVTSRLASRQRVTRHQNIVWLGTYLGSIGCGMCFLLMMALTAKQAYEKEPELWAMLWSAIYCAGAAPFCMTQAWTQCDAISRGSTIKGRVAADRNGEASPARRANTIREFLARDPPPLLHPNLTKTSPARVLVSQGQAQEGDELLMSPQDSSEEETDEEAAPSRGFCTIDTAEETDDKEAASSAQTRGNVLNADGQQTDLHEKDLAHASWHATSFGDEEPSSMNTCFPTAPTEDLHHSFEAQNQSVEEEQNNEAATPRSLHSTPSKISQYSASSRDALLGQPVAQPYSQYHVVRAGAPMPRRAAPHAQLGRLA